MWEPHEWRLIEWWTGLPRPVRYAIGIIMTLVGAAGCYIEQDPAWFVWGPVAICGIVLILFAGD